MDSVQVLTHAVLSSPTGDFNLYTMDIHFMPNFRTLPWTFLMDVINHDYLLYFVNFFSTYLNQFKLSAEEFF